MIPIAQKLNSGKAASKSAKSDEFPPTKFLELKISTSDDGGNSTTHPYTVKNLVDFYQTQGASVTWSKNGDGVPVLATKKSGKTTSIGLYEDNGVANGYSGDDLKLNKAVAEMSKKSGK